MDGGDPAGGSGELARLIDEHGEHIVADLKHHYGVDLKDVLVPGSGLTSRLVLTYLRGLPLGSSFMASVRGGKQFEGWDTQTYMLAHLIDAVRENTYAFICANSKRKPKAPKPVDRPTVKTPASGNQFAAMARLAHARGKKKGTTANGSGTGR